MRTYGWIADPSHRVAQMPLASAGLLLGAAEPVGKGDLSPYEGGRRFQLKLGACCAFTFNDCLHTRAVAMGLGKPEDVPHGSELFSYIGGRAIDHTITSDIGTYFSSILGSMQVEGLPDQKFWPYDISKFAVRPPLIAYQAGFDFYKTVSAHRISEADDARERLVQQAIDQLRPVGIGLGIDHAFENAEPGDILDAPKLTDIIGGHALKVKGYEKLRTINRTIYRIRNWWDDWGEDGEIFVTGAFLAAANDVYVFDTAGVPGAK